MTNPVTGAVIMVGNAGPTAAEQLMQAAHQASTRDLIAQLQRFEVHPIIVAAPKLDWLANVPGIICDEDPHNTPFHFGDRLAGLIERHHLTHVLYFGGGSAPLMDDNILSTMGMLLERAGDSASTRIPSHIALTNNKHSSDWLALTQAQDALSIIRQTDRDNSLAWLLDQQGVYDVRVIAGMRPATAMDLDTPSDLAIVGQHPDIKPALRAVLERYPALNTLPVKPIAALAARPETHLMLAGRVSPLAWQALNKATQSWIRVYAEERGMVASGRLDRGEVKSLLGDLLRVQGPHGFFETLSTMTDAAIIDCRPLMASQGHWPSDTDRFASDLMQADHIENGWLREFTEAAHNAAIPVLLGGHSVVAGGLYALVEIIEQEKRLAQTDTSLFTQSD